MDSKLIQKRVDDIAAAMVAKGVREPSASLDIRSHQDSQVVLRWTTGLADGRYSYRDNEYKFFTGNRLTILNEAAAFVAEMPSAEQARMHDFMAALGSVIDLGREHGIEADYLNPLVASMKKLSEAVITDQRAA